MMRRVARDPKQSSISCEINGRFAGSFDRSRVGESCSNQAGARICQRHTEATACVAEPNPHVVNVEELALSPRTERSSGRRNARVPVRPPTGYSLLDDDIYC